MHLRAGCPAAFLVRATSVGTRKNPARPHRGVDVPGRRRRRHAVKGAVDAEGSGGETERGLIVAPTVTAGFLRVVVPGRDLVAEESPCSGAGLFDLLGLGFRSGETGEVITAWRT